MRGLAQKLAYCKIGGAWISSKAGLTNVLKREDVLVIADHKFKLENHLWQAVQAFVMRCLSMAA